MGASPEGSPAVPRVATMESVATEAEVIHVDPGNHCLAEYSFQSSGRSYVGSGANCRVDVGQKVSTSYLPTNPNLPCLCSPPAALANELMTFGTAGVLVPPLFILRNRFARKR